MKAKGEIPMKLKALKQFAFLFVAGLVGMGAGMAIMWGTHSASAAGEVGHGHELEFHQGVEATCETTGYKDYWECPECHLYFSDADGINEIKAEDFAAWHVAPKINHDFHLHEYKNATCDHDGHRDYLYCDQCEKYFDPKTKTEITYESTIIHNTNRSHEIGALVPYEPATCEHEGHYAYRQCVHCDQYFNEYGIACNYSDLVIPTVHHVHYEAAQAPTCEHTGSRAYYVCDDCGRKFADENCTEPLTDDEVVVAKLNHWSEGNQHFARKEATCLEDGNPEYWVCIHGCGQKFVDQACTRLLDESIFEAYKAYDHDWQMICLPENRVDDAVPYRYLDAENKVKSVNVMYYQTCTRCGEHQGGQTVPSFAKLVNNNFNRNNVTIGDYETTGVERIIDYDVFKISASALTATESGYDAVIKITLPGTYSQYSQYKFDDVLFEDMSNVVDNDNGVMLLQVHCDTLPTAETVLIWQFNWDGDGVFEQKIKVVITVA